MEERKEIQCLTKLLTHALKCERAIPQDLTSMMKDIEEDQMLALAKMHAVAPLISELWQQYEQMDERVKTDLDVYTQNTINRSYRLLFYTKYLVGLLEAEGIPVAVLKGVATAEYYPQPELRKAGDIDLLLFSDKDCERAVECLKTHGFSEHGESHLHHVAMMGEEQIEVELHGMLVEPFDHKETNQIVSMWQQEARDDVQYQSCMGVMLPVLTGVSHGLSLLLHLLQHFLTAGFGIKLLCDWVVFWEKEPKEVADELAQRTRQLKVEQFVAAVTGVCVNMLGMDAAAAAPFLEMAEPAVKDAHYLEQFFWDIMEAGEFGKTQNARMLALHETGIAGYVRAFHHQMKLNYPRASRCVMIFPALWVLTFARFLHNNRTLRKTTVREILSNANKRGRIAEKMHLFE